MAVVQQRDAFLDRSSLGRFAVGMLMSLVGVPFPTAAVLLAAFEVAEGPVAKALPSAFPHYADDDWKAKTGDLLAGLAGYGLVAAIPNGRGYLSNGKSGT